MRPQAARRVAFISARAGEADNRVADVDDVLACDVVGEELAPLAAPCAV